MTLPKALRPSSTPACEGATPIPRTISVLSLHSCFHSLGESASLVTRCLATLSIGAMFLTKNVIRVARSLPTFWQTPSFSHAQDRTGGIANHCVGIRAEAAKRFLEASAPDHDQVRIVAQSLLS